MSCPVSCLGSPARHSWVPAPRLTGGRQSHQRKGQVGPTATAGGGRRGKASTPALGPGEASERHRGLVFVQKAQELQGGSGGCPGLCSPVTKGAGEGPQGSAAVLRSRVCFHHCVLLPAGTCGVHWELLLGQKLCLPRGKAAASSSPGTASMQETAQRTGRGAQPGTRPQQEQPWARWHGRMSPGEEHGPSVAPREAGTGR